MKRLLIFLMALSLLAACNNDKGNGRDEKRADYREKDDYGTNDDQSNEKSRKDDDSNSDENTSSDGWSEKDKSKFLSDCMGEAGDDQALAKKICPCALEKMEKKYSSLSEAESGGGATAKRMGKECMEELNKEANNDDNNSNEDVDNDKSNNNGGSGWPESEVKDFITTCVKSAQKNGLEYLDAQSYCDCMQYKLEKLYPNVYDKRLKNLDMESPSIKKMVQSCLPGN